MVESPDWHLESNIFVVVIFKRLGAFFPQAQQVCVEKEAQYED